MALNINGTTGISGVDGSVSAPALTGTDSNTGITFPAADSIKFSTGGVERISITNSGISGTGISSGGLYASYALIADIKANSVIGGGTLTSVDWRTRDLNTELHDADGIVSISSNQFTLQAGTYRIYATTPSYRADRHQAALYNVTDSSYVQFGTVAYTLNSENVTNESILRTRFTISGAKVFEIRQRLQNSVTDYGGGVGLASYWTGSSIFTVVEIFKEN